MRAGNLERKGLIDYNVEVLKEALKDVLGERSTRTPRVSIASNGGYTNNGYSTASPARGFQG
jgi:hypothetical protein